MREDGGDDAASLVACGAEDGDEFLGGHGDVVLVVVLELCFVCLECDCLFLF